MEEYLELISVPVIAAVVYWSLYIVRTVVKSDKLDRFVPLLSAALGIVCGVVCFYAAPSIIPAKNVVVAAIIGGASGLTATGTHQIVKQLSKSKGNDSTNSSDKSEKPKDDADTDNDDKNAEDK